MAATIFDNLSSSSFLPAFQILSRCAIVEYNVTLGYGEDHVQVAIPLSRLSFS